MSARVLVAGVASGSGKTTFATGLLAALARTGLAVQGFKVGPDFLDPTYHRAATGRPGINLDGFLHGRRLVRTLLARGLSGVDIGVIEGVMGLLDGRGSSTSASSAEIARWTKTPVLLVVDAAGMAQSVAAVVDGFRRLARGVAIEGVLLNRVGSARHFALLRDALARHRLPPAIGYLPRFPELMRPSRHLGLVRSEELPDLSLYLETLARAVGETVDLEAVLEVARSAPPLDAAAHEQTAAGRGAVRVAYALDPAFSFYYTSSLDALRTLGGTLLPFSPLRDAALPQGSEAVYLGGGYPELYAAELAANGPMLEAIRTFAGPIYAECGGLMYLAQTLTDQEGRTVALVGRVPGHVAMTEGRAALGYGVARLLQDTVLGPKGTRLRGHVFHWSRLESHGPPALTVQHSDGREEAEGYAEDGLLASFLHIDFAAHPLAARRFLRAARRRPGMGHAAKHA